MTDLHDKEKGKKMEYLNGMKPCKHKKTFYGMLGGRCIKCGGYLNSVGWNKRLSIKNRKAGEKPMGEEITYSINDTTRAITKVATDLNAFQSPLCDGRVKAMILTKLQEARLLSLELIKKE